MVFIQASTAVLLLVSRAAASPIANRDASTPVLPVPESTSSPSPLDEWNEGWETKYPIHRSCNSTLRAQLEIALDETVQLAQHARDHLLRHGHDSEFVRKYFGNGSTAYPIGWFDRVVGADKTGMLFRCDDPDENCATQDSRFCWLLSSNENWASP
jgi:hypothetical protein